MIASRQKIPFTTARLLTGGLAVGLLALACCAAPAGARARVTRATGSAPLPATCGEVHMGPVNPAGTPRLNYLLVHATPGRTYPLRVVLANPAPTSCAVQILPAYGKTAVNSGDTYPPADDGHGHCVATGCWLAGLPRTVTVPSGHRLYVDFSLTVPPGTHSGDHLAGVIGEPVGQPSAPAPIPHGVAARVLARVDLGVAVTVPGPQYPALSIPTVTAPASGVAGMQQLSVVESNSGNTWEHPVGRALIGVGSKQPSFKLASNTVLPGDHATLSLGVGGVPQGLHPVEVDLWYDHHRREAIWRGKLNFGAVAKVTGHGSQRTVVEPATLPGWAKKALIALGALALLQLLSFFLLGWRRRRRRDDDALVIPLTPPAGGGLSRPPTA